MESNDKQDLLNKAPAGAAASGPDDSGHAPRAGALAEEPEDAYLTGSSRSLQRRLMGLNITGATEPPAGSDTDRTPADAAPAPESGIPRQAVIKS